MWFTQTAQIRWISHAPAIMEKIVMSAMLATNIIIDYLNREEKSKKTIQFYTQSYVKIITYIAVLGWISTPGDSIILQDFLKYFHIINLDTEIADLAIVAKQQYKLRIPNALILASAQQIGTL